MGGNLNIQINPSMINIASEQKGPYSINQSSSEYPTYIINFSQEGPVLFKIVLKKSKQKTYSCNFTAFMGNARNLDELLNSLYLYKAFYERTIKINGVKLFGGIITGDFSDMPKDNIDDTIQYWKRIKKLETKLDVTFKPVIPVPDEDAKFLEQLCISFLDNMPFRVGYINSLEIMPNDLSEIKKAVKSEGNLSFIVPYKQKDIMGVDFETLYAVLYLGQVEIMGYDVMDEKHKAKIKLKCNSKTMSAMKFFKEKEAAEEYLKNESDKFKNAKKLWE